MPVAPANEASTEQVAPTTVAPAATVPTTRPTPTTAPPATAAPSTTAPSTTNPPTTAPPATLAPTTTTAPERIESQPRTVGLSTACPAAAADRIGGRGQLEVEANFSTTQYVIWICRDTVADNLWYHASTKGQDVGGRITLPAVRAGDGYEARNGQSVYRITNDRITLTTPTGKLMIDQKVSIS